MTTLRCISCCLWLLVAAQVAADDDYVNTLGWEWRVAPTAPRSFFASRGYLMISESGPNGQFNVTLARRTADDRVRGTHIVAFDKHRRPHRLVPQQGGGQGGVSLQRWILPVENLRASEVHAYGIESLTLDSVAKATKDATERARNSGIEVLPFPLVGEPYNFALTAKSGHHISSDRVKGNVVLIDCWATWCSPCVEKLPWLNSLHGKYSDKGLTVVGVNFDQSPDAMKQVIARLELDWPSISVPSDDETRDMWHAVNGIMALPRILVVDRTGVLRADFDDIKANQLESLVTRLLAESE